MFTNSVKYTLRLLRKDKMFTFVNVSGFAIGMTVCTIITLFIINELSYDHYQKNYNNIYVVYHSDADFNNSLASTPFIFAETIKNKIPEIEKTAQVSYFNWAPAGIIKNNRSIKIENCYYADNEIFDILDYKFISGGKVNFADKINSVLISRSAAEKYIDTGINSSGKKIEMQLNGKKYVLEIAGIFEDVPQNSHMRPDFILPMELMKKDNPESVMDWGYNNLCTYLLLSKSASIPEVERKIQQYISGFMNRKYHLMALADVHLNTKQISIFGNRGDINKLYVYLAIGILILLIACINYINFSAAKTAERSKEIAVRKIIGAGRYTLSFQLFMEPVLLAVVSLPVTLLLVYFISSSVEELFDRKLFAGFTGNAYLYMSLAGVFILTGAISGIFSAAMLSGSKPLALIDRHFQRGTKRSYLRTGLVFFQVVIFSGLVICSFIIYSQMKRIKNSDLGFKKECVFTCQLPEGDYKGKQQAFLNEIKKYHDVANATIASVIPPGVGNIVTTRGRFKTPKGNNIDVTILECDENYINVLGLFMAEGEFFKPKNENVQDNGIIINEKLKNLLGVKRGSREYVRGSYKTAIRGVVKDFTIFSAYEPVPPILFLNSEDFVNQIAVKVNPQNIDEAVNIFKQKWSVFFPDEICDYKFIDEEFDKKYRDDERFGKLIAAFTFISVVIAGAGLAGLTAYTISKKKKEIAVRKVLGATVFDITYMLTKEIVAVCVIGYIVSIPLAYRYMNIWLEKFSDRISITYPVFIGAFVLTISIALSAIMYQSVKSALNSQMESLRSE